MSCYYSINYSNSKTIDICEYDGTLMHSAQLGESIFSFLSLDLVHYEHVRGELITFAQSKNKNKRELNTIVRNHPSVGDKLDYLSDPSREINKQHPFVIYESLLEALIYDNNYINNHSEILNHPYVKYSDIYNEETWQTKENFDSDPYINDTDLYNLQTAYKKIVPYCFDIDFDPDLNILTAYERYYLFILRNSYTKSKIEDTICYSVIHTPITTIKDITALIKLPKILSKFNNITPNDEPTSVSKSEVINQIKEISPIAVHALECKSPRSIAFNELRFMLEQNISIKKCKNCGKYFILKGDYATEYCDRIPRGEKFTCKKLSAVNNRKEKLTTNPILKEYDRAYKRMYARNKNHKITPDEYKSWLTEANKQRDFYLEKFKAEENDMTIDEFKKFLGNK